MRCPECGHSLLGVPDQAPCPECGVASAAAEREPKPLPSPGKLLWWFGWPSIAGAAIIVLSSFIMNTFADGVTIAGVMAGGVLLLLVGPVNSARQTSILMKRLPRRVRSAPLLALVPRIVLVPLLAGLATIPINVAVGFGSCVAFILVGEQRS